ncbi:MAG: hypothetical protein OHK0029_43070 [Armatimonadaceae bacterium]
MAVKSTELDPKIAQALAEREAELLKDPASPATPPSPPAPPSPVAPATMPSTAVAPVESPSVRVEITDSKATPETEAEKRALEILAKHGARRGSTLKDKVGMTLTGAAIAGAGYLLGPEGLGPLLAYGFGGLLVLGGVFTDLRRFRQGSKSGEAIHYPAEVLEVLLDLLELQPVEKRYGELMVVLAQEHSAIDTTTRQNLISQANGLLEDFRQLEQKRTEILAEHTPETIAAIETERQRLVEEARAATDPVVRQTKEKSAELLAHRVEDTTTILQVAERMSAQQEAILETLGTLRSTLIRLSVAPSRLKETEINPLYDTIEQTRRQTVAVEQSVEEVIALTGERL